MQFHYSKEADKPILTVSESCIDCSDYDSLEKGKNPGLDARKELDCIHGLKRKQIHYPIRHESKKFKLTKIKVRRK